MKIFIFLVLTATTAELVAGNCAWNGGIYPIRYVLELQCQSFECVQTACGVPAWKPISQTCFECCAYDDPHIRPFDNVDSYEFHRFCRYAVAVHVDAWALKAGSNFGVLGDFKPCSTGSSFACVGITSVQVGSDYATTVLHVKHSNVQQIFQFGFVGPITITSFYANQVVIVNTFNVLAWSANGCTFIATADLLIKICPHGVCVHTTKANYGHLGGLCGKFDFDGSNDHTAKDNTNYGYSTYPPSPFGDSWQVDPIEVLGDPDCTKIDDVTRNPGTKEEYEKYKGLCEETLGRCTNNAYLLQDILESCAWDICANKGADIDLWLKIALENCRNQEGPNPKLQAEAATALSEKA